MPMGNPTQIVLGPENDQIEVARFASVGGNASMTGGLELIVPTPLLGEEATRSVRTSGLP